MDKIKNTLLFAYKTLKRPEIAMQRVLSGRKLINDLFLIYSIKYQFPVLDKVILYVTNFCNAHCLMCDVGMHEDKGMDILRKSNRWEMSLELLKKISNDPYVLKQRPLFNILMTEPLLHSRIGAIVKELKKNKYEVNITTNGSLLPQKAQELAESGLDSLQVSIDGPLDLHNRIRGIDIYQKALEGIKRVSAFNSNLLININCVVSNLNFSYLTELVREIDRKNIPINQFKFQFMYFVSDVMQKANNQLGINGIIQTESTVSDYVNPDKVNIEILYRELQELRRMRTRNVKKIRIIPNITSKKELKRYFDSRGEKVSYYNYCAWPFRQIAIRTDGAVFFHIRCFNYFLGSIPNSSIEEILFSSKARYFRKQFKKYDFCFPACTRCCGVAVRPH